MDFYHIKKTQLGFPGSVVGSIPSQGTTKTNKQAKKPKMNKQQKNKKTPQSINVVSKDAGCRQIRKWCLHVFSNDNRPSGSSYIKVQH